MILIIVLLILEIIKVFVVFIGENDFVNKVVNVNWKVVMFDVLLMSFLLDKMFIECLGMLIWFDNEFIVIVFVGFRVVLKVK